MIYPKQQLSISESVSGTGDGQTDTSNQADEQETFVYHVVQSGQTLWDIANLYPGATVEKIKTWNHITNAKTLQPGQKLKIAVQD